MAATGAVLFIDARKLGRMETRVTRVFDEPVNHWRVDGEVNSVAKSFSVG